MIQLQVKASRNQTKNPKDSAGIQRFHEQRAKLVHGLVHSLDLNLKGGVYDTVKGGRPREDASFIVALGSSGVFTAMVSAFKVWLERKKMKEVQIKVGRKWVKMSGVSADDVAKLTKTLGLV